MRHLILTNQFDEALRIGKKYSFVPHFAASLEFLLHQTLEVYLQELTDQDSHLSKNKSAGDLGQLEKNVSGRSSPALVESPQKAPKAPSIDRPETKAAWVLKKTMDLLKEFVLQFPTVVVQVARKTDARYWQLIFSFAGEAAGLFAVRKFRFLVTRIFQLLRLFSLNHSKPLRMRKLRLRHHICVYCSSLTARGRLGNALSRCSSSPWTRMTCRSSRISCVS